MEDGTWIVNGDETLLDETELRAFYDEVFHDSSLIVNRVNNQDDRWTAQQALNLTYCVSDRFGSRKSGIVTAMAQGAAMWEGASGGTCFEDNNWRALTAYDANSIMHYPNCNGGSRALTWSSTDATGARARYGS